MTLAIRVESGQETQTGQRQRLTAQTRPRVLEDEHGGRRLLRRSFQLDEWEMPASRQVSHVQFDPLAAASTDARLRPSTRRAPRPMSSRFNPWLAPSRPSVEVDLVRHCTIQGVVRSVTVVPVRKKRQLPAKGVALVGDQQSPRALALQRSNEAFDNGDALRRRLHRTAAGCSGVRTNARKPCRRTACPGQ